jgi:hypothetical protein
VPGLEDLLGEDSEQTEGLAEKSVVQPGQEGGSPSKRRRLK